MPQAGCPSQPLSSLTIWIYQSIRDILRVCQRSGMRRDMNRVNYRLTFHNLDSSAYGNYTWDLSGAIKRGPFKS